MCKTRSNIEIEQFSIGCIICHPESPNLRIVSANRLAKNVALDNLKGKRLQNVLEIVDIGDSSNSSLTDFVTQRRPFVQLYVIFHKNPSLFKVMGHWMNDKVVFTFYPCEL